MSTHSAAGGSPTQQISVPWPLTGRATQLAELSRLLASNRGGVLLAGPAGAGKTRLAAELLREAETNNCTALQVAATQSGSEIPFGAFAPLLPDLNPGVARVQMLRQIVRAIVERGAGKPVVLLVDDAHLLDPASAVLVHQLAQGPDVFVVATVRPDGHTPDAVLALWKDGLLNRVDVGPLSPDEVDELLAAALGGAVERRTCQRLYQRSDGNVLFLRELVHGALDAGVLRTGPNGWHLTAPMPSSARLIELVDARLGVLPDHERAVLEVLALGEPLPIEMLDWVVDDANLDRLIRQQLIVEEVRAGQVVLRLGHPVYGDVLRSLLSTSRTRTLYRRLADALDNVDSPNTDDVLRLASWRLESGGPMQARTMLAGATRAWTLHELPLAERLATAASTLGGGFDADLLLGQVLCAAGRPQESEGHLAGLAATTLTDAQRVRTTIARLDNLCYSMGRLDLALDLATRSEGRLCDTACRDEITAHRASLLDTSGQTTQALSVAAPLLERTTGGTRVWAGVMTTLGLAKTGAISRALSIADDTLTAYQQLTEPPLQWGIALVATRCWALHFGGRLAEAETLALEEHQRGVGEGDAEAEFVMGSILGMVNIAQGRVQTAARRAREAADLAHHRGRLIHTRLALIPLIEALALRGNATAAHDAVAELERSAVPHVHMIDAEVWRVTAWAYVASGDHRKAIALLNTAIATAQDSGDRVSETAALHDLARLGQAAAVCEQLADLAQTVEGPWAQARATHATALARTDPVLLKQASQSFADMGAILLAAEAAADAAVAHCYRDEARPAQAARRLAAQLSQRCEGAKTPALDTDTATRAVLSPRELEIARLAATGHSDKDIGQRLYISHRTVENRLHRTYTKLGITNRHELANALNGLGEVEPQSHTPGIGDN